MPSASQRQYSSNSMARDIHRTNGLGRLHNSYASSQTSLQKLPVPAPQFYYPINNSPYKNIQMPTSQTKVTKPNHTVVTTNNLMAQSTSGMQVSNMMSSPETVNNFSNGYVPMPSVPHLPQPENLSNQPTILMSTGTQKIALKQPTPIPPPLIQQSQLQVQQSTQQQQQQSQQQINYQQQYAQQQINHQQLLNNQNNQASLDSQVPMTTVMIPATAAAQLQSASQQIQQAAMQAMISQNQLPQPQILVLMIPYFMNQPPPTIASSNTPEQTKFGTLTRQSHSISVASNISAPNSRTMSSLSFTKQEPERFFVKANFSYHTKAKNEISFKRGEILHVLDTFPNSEEEHQNWFVSRVNSSGAQEKGLVPSQSKAEKIVQEQQNLEYNDQKSGGSHSENGGHSSVLSASVGKVNFLKRRAARRSKSFSKDNWDNVVFEIGSCKLPAYERVVYKHPGFCRPVVIFGPLADIAREKLLKDYPEKYSYPIGFNKNQMANHPKVIRLKNIQEIIDQGKYALLDITPSAVEKLNYVNLCPIVIFMKAEKHIVKEFRQRAIKSLNENDNSESRFDGESSRKLIEQANKLEKLWSHVFTATLNLSSMGSEMWYRKLRETIENQQSMNVWMGERKQDKKLAKMSSSMSDVLFPMPDYTTDNNIAQSSSFIDDAGISNDDSDDSISKSTMNLHLMSHADYDHQSARSSNNNGDMYATKSGNIGFYDRGTQQKDIYERGSLHIQPFYERDYTQDHNYCEASYFN